MTPDETYRLHLQDAVSCTQHESAEEIFAHIQLRHQQLRNHTINQANDLQMKYVR